MKLKPFLVGFAFLFCLISAYLAWVYYQRIFSVNVTLDKSSAIFYIGSDWDFKTLSNALSEQGIIDDTASFNWVAEKKKYPGKIIPGKYIIPDGLNNNQLVNLLRSGEQQPVKMLLRSVRTIEELAANVSQYIEADSATLKAMLQDKDFAAKYGFTSATFLTMFLPNTYEFYWATDEEEFVVRMAREYKRFWTEDRKQKALELGLSQSEVSILASIVQSEQAAHPDERPIVAGLYLNRLRKGMRLESDPTLIHAIGDFSIKRVLNIHKQIESPYNTYKRAGLPPGPILLPELTSIDAVLNPTKHNYLFMCAKEDFSGYHNFAVSYREHVNNAKRYQQELNKRKIYK
jgi:UPF0755 protein